MTVTSTIGSSGRNYATLALWEASIPATLADAYIGECYNDSNSFVSASTLLTLSGHTTTATFNITLTTGAGQSFRDNAGAQTNALEYNQANGVGIECTGNYNQVIHVTDDYVTIENLQILYTGTTSDNALYQGSSNFVANYCIIQGPYTPLFMYNLGVGTYISNSLIYKTGNSSSPIASLNSTCAARFCTFVVPSDIATKPTNAITGSYGTNTIENCAVFGGAANVFGGGSSTFTATTCMTDTASPPSGFTTVTYANQFVGTTLAAPDFREKAGANLQGAATADATYGAFDIVGTARPQGTNWDIGSWELASGAGTSFTAVSATGAIVSFKISLSKGLLAAVSAMGGVGIIVPASRASLVGVAAVAAVEPLSVTHPQSLAGVSATAATGGFSPKVSVIFGAVGALGRVANFVNVAPVASFTRFVYGFVSRVGRLLGR